MVKIFPAESTMLGLVQNIIYVHTATTAAFSFFLFKWPVSLHLLQIRPVPQWRMSGDRCSRVLYITCPSCHPVSSTRAHYVYCSL